MWSKSVTIGCVLMVAAWVAAAGLVLAGWLRDAPYLAHAGIVAAAMGGTLTLSREHQRTRRSIRAAESRLSRPGSSESSGGVVREFARRDDY